MDTSKEYIKMCDCPEIQKLLKTDEMDYRSQGYCTKHQTLISEDHDGGADCEGFQAIRQAAWCKGGHKAEDNVYQSDDFCHFRHWIMLPRQDQLQEMLNYGEDCSYPVSHLVRHIDEFYSKLDYWGEDAGAITMEQLWLTFVMSEKYGKTWSGTEWVDKG